MRSPTEKMKELVLDLDKLNMPALQMISKYQNKRWGAIDPFKLVALLGDGI